MFDTLQKYESQYIQQIAINIWHLNHQEFCWGGGVAVVWDLF